MPQSTKVIVRFLANVGNVAYGHKTFMINDTSYKPCALCTDITPSQCRVATRTRAPLPFVCPPCARGPSAASAVAVEDDVERVDQPVTAQPDEDRGYGRRKVYLRLHIECIIEY